MACTECAELSTHAFRSADDLIHALRVAAEESNRGVLAPIEEREPPRAAEEEAIYSALDSGALPGAVRYRFRCTTCGDRFTLAADVRSGSGSWSRQSGEAQAHVDAIAGFLAAIGITMRERDLREDTFLPGIAIEAGALLVDRTRLTWPGDLLHEAGHIAVTPPAPRARLWGRVAPDSAGDHDDEPMVTAWAFAALTAIGLPPTVLFHEGGYHGKSASLAFTYSNGCYPGVAGLVAAGMALEPAAAAARGAQPYPRMLRWLRE